MLRNETDACGHAPHAVPVGGRQAGWLNECALAEGLGADDITALDRIASLPRLVHRGAYIHRAGALFRALYVLRAGSVKGVVVNPDGQDRIVGVHFRGDVIGIDGIGRGRHSRDAVALEESSVSEIPFAALEQLARTSAAVQRNVHRLLGQEIVEKHRQLLLLGTMQAPQRVAAFLLRSHERMTERGYAPGAIELHLTRAEIGSHLALSLETVSRIVTRMDAVGLVDALRKGLRIKDSAGLSALLRTQG